MASEPTDSRFASQGAWDLADPLARVGDPRYDPAAQASSGATAGCRQDALAPGGKRLIVFDVEVPGEEEVRLTAPDGGVAMLNVGERRWAFQPVLENASASAASVDVSEVLQAVDGGDDRLALRWRVDLEPTKQATAFLLPFRLTVVQVRDGRDPRDATASGPFAKAGDGRRSGQCCVSCNGDAKVCGCAVDRPCGSCCVGSCC
jgi:hypothetical protein